MLSAGKKGINPFFHSCYFVVLLFFEGVWGNLSFAKESSPKGAGFWVPQA
jgi:hypothetical protein